MSSITTTTNLTPDVVNTSVKSAMRLVADVYDNSKALGRNNTLSSDYLESQKVTVTSEQRKSLADIDALRNDIQRLRSRNIRMNIVIRMLCAVAIIAALYSSALVILPSLAWENPKTRYPLLTAVLASTVIVFAWYANKFIRNLSAY